LCIGLHLFSPILFIAADPDLRNENKDTKIVGGEEAAAGRYTWEVSIALSRNIPTSPEERLNTPPSTKESAHHCDGILLHPYFVLTAAHCVVDLQTFRPFDPPSQLQVGAGSNDLDVLFDRGRIPVDQIYIQQRIYQPGMATSPADIAIIRLQSSAFDSAPRNQIGFACLLRDPSFQYYSPPLLSIGFGNTHALYYNLTTNDIVSGIQPSRYLKEINVLDITPEANRGRPEAMYCRGRRDLICITSIQPPDSTCQGDSGGSLVVPINSRQSFVVGLVSFGDSGISTFHGEKQRTTCRGQTSYTRISTHIDWINNILRGQFCNY
jgi:secreted trypsin-like serine protease